MLALSRNGSREEQVGGAEARASQGCSGLLVVVKHGADKPRAPSEGSWMAAATQPLSCHPCVQAAPEADEQLLSQLQRPSPQHIGGSNAALRPQPSTKAGSGTARKQPDRERRHGGGELRKRGLARSGSPQRGTQSMTALTALGAVALYTSVRGGITVFHHLRRRYLRQLLCDLAAALNDLGQCYWLDFGRWAPPARHVLQHPEGSGALRGQGGHHSVDCLGCSRRGLVAWLTAALVSLAPAPAPACFCSLLGLHRDGDLILHDNDVDIAVYQPQWPALLRALRAALPQYTVRIVVPSDDPSTRFIRVYCPLGMADVFGATPVAGAAEGKRLLVDWWVWGKGRWKGRAAHLLDCAPAAPPPLARLCSPCHARHIVPCGLFAACAPDCCKKLVAAAWGMQDGRNVVLGACIAPLLPSHFAFPTPTVLQWPRGLHRDHQRQCAAHRLDDLAGLQDQRARRHPRCA